MGYRSQIAIAVDKHIITQDLIHPLIPPVLRFEEERKITDAGCFWVLEDWKWYDSDSDVRDILRFFEEMDDIPRFTYKTDKFHLVEYTQAAYGAIRIGEDDDDSEYWGSPEEFDMYMERNLITPYYPD
jgi:hypothetical protein